MKREIDKISDIQCTEVFKERGRTSLSKRRFEFAKHGWVLKSKLSYNRFTKDMSIFYQCM